MHRSLSRALSPPSFDVEVIAEAVCSSEIEVEIECGGKLFVQFMPWCLNNYILVILVSTLQRCIFLWPLAYILGREMESRA